jgi:Fe2+ transport system protein FeoA
MLTTTIAERLARESLGFRGLGEQAPAEVTAPVQMPEAIYATATNPKTKQKVGFDGKRWIPIYGTATHKDDPNDRIAILLDGTVVPFYPVAFREVEQALEKPSVMKRGLHGLMRTMGIVAGTLQAPFAFLGGVIAADPRQEPRPLTVQEIKDSTLAGIVSAYEAIAKEGKWGTSMSEGIARAEGFENLGELLRHNAKLEDRLGKSPNLYAAAAVVTDMSALALDIVLEGVLAAGANVGKVMPWLGKVYRRLRAMKALTPAERRAVKDLKKLIEDRSKAENLIRQLSDKKYLERATDFKREIARRIYDQQARIDFHNRRRLMEEIVPVGREIPPEAQRIMDLASMTEKATYAKSSGVPALDFINKIRREMGLPEYRKGGLTPQEYVESLGKRTYPPRRGIAEWHENVENLKEAIRNIYGEAEADKLARMVEAEEGILERIKKPFFVKPPAQQDVLKAVRQRIEPLKDHPGIKSYEPKAKVKPETDITLESTGLQQLFEAAQKGLKKIKRRVTDLPETKDEVLYSVQETLKEAYRPIIPRVDVETDIKGRLLEMGYKVGKRKNRIVLKKVDPSGFITVKGKRRPVGEMEFKDLNEVVKEFGWADSLKDYSDLRHTADVETAASEGLDAFISWALKGKSLDEASVDELWNAAKRMRVRVQKAKHERFGDKSIKAFDMVLGNVPSGRKLSRLMFDLRDKAEIGTAKDWYEIFSVVKKHKITDDELDDLRMILDGYGDRLPREGNEHLFAAAEEIRPTLDKVYALSEKYKDIGIPVAGYRVDYFPHRMLPIDVLEKGPKRTEVLNAVVREGRFESIPDAEKALDGYIYSIKTRTLHPAFLKWLVKKTGSETKALRIWEDFIRPKKVPTPGHFKFERLADLPWYDRDPRSALAEYLAEVHKASGIAEAFGKGLRKRFEIVDRIRAEGGNFKVADEILERYINPMSDRLKHPTELTRRLMAIQAVTKLNPLTTVVNFSQALAVGLQTDIKAFLKMFRQYDREFADKVGVTFNRTIQDVLKAHGLRGRFSTEYLRWIGFTKSEEVLRTLAASAGKQHIYDLVEMANRGKRLDYVRRKLDQMGLDAEKIIKRGYTTDEEVELFAKRVSDRTQFRGDKFDLPLDWLGPYGRVITQFKTFVYNQGRLLGRTALKELAKGNPRPLMFFATAYPIAGTIHETVVNDLLLGRRPPQSDLESLWRYFSSVGGLGILQTVAESAFYGEKGVLQLLVGPSLADLSTLVQLGLLRKNFWEEGLGRLPGVGRVIRAHIQRKKRLSMGLGVTLPSIGQVKRGPLEFPF